MKKLFFAISFLAIAAASFAGTNSKSISPEMRLDNAIQEQVSVPNFLMDREGTHNAEVHFSVKADGRIHIREIACGEKDLTENLVYQIQALQVNTAGLDLNDTYKVTVRFNVQ